MPRSVPEWIGKTPDEKVPPRVRERVLEAHGRICHISKRKIRPGDPWDLDHVIELCNDGENRESNLAPALRDKHRAKTALAVAVKAHTAKRAKTHAGIKGVRRRILSAGFPSPPERVRKLERPLPERRWSPYGAALSLPLRKD